VDPTTLKYFCLAYNIKRRQLRIVKRETKTVLVEDIIGDSPKWGETIKVYQDALKKHDEGKNIRKSKLWQWEYNNAPKENKSLTKYRIKNYLALYENVKKGYVSNFKNMIRLIDIRSLPEPDAGYTTTRFSKKYFRQTGMKRCIICDYLGIKKINCRILKPKFVQI
jgi:hypothetical protein